ncbi:hypothetical protein FKM82_016965 [Ascaphus truei]
MIWNTSIEGPVPLCEWRLWIAEEAVGFRCCFAWFQVARSLPVGLCPPTYNYPLVAKQFPSLCQHCQAFLSCLRFVCVLDLIV